MRPPTGWRLVVAAVVAAAALVTTTTTSVEAVRRLAGGFKHSCAIIDSGAVQCWGRNSFGQLGIGSTSHMGDGANEMGDRLPVANMGSDVSTYGAADVGTGEHHTCVIASTTGAVKCWGRNQYGQLGLGDSLNRGEIALTMGDQLPLVQLGAGRYALNLAVGFYHTCVRLDNSKVKCWGRNDASQLGLGDASPWGDNSGEMGANLPYVSLGTGRTVLVVRAGGEHTCAILDTNQLRCWGKNAFGQLGLGDTATRGDGVGLMGDSLPLVSLPTGRAAAEIGLGFTHTCVILDNGSVVCFGENADGELGIDDVATRGDGAGEMGDALPIVALGTGRRAVALALGSWRSCALLDNARIRCWGYNEFGQAGLGDTISRGVTPGQMGDALPYVDVGSGANQNVSAMAGGWHHTCVVLANRAQVKCFGQNDYGELGLGNTLYKGDGANEMGDYLPMVSLTTTLAPSKAPTTTIPSKAPSQSAPTRSPSRAPSRNPTKSPSRSPSRAPSRSPSRSPSTTPSRKPTSKPTSAKPTQLPSHAPTTSPTTNTNVATLSDTVKVVSGVVGAVLGFGFLGLGVFAAFFLRRRSKHNAALAREPDTMAFLTHEWGQDVGHTNHRRVAAVNAALKAQGVSTWFDEERLGGNVVEQITAGIEKTHVVVVFLTKRYMDKVQQGSGKLDYCRMEFLYATRAKSVDKMVVVVMEPELRDSTLWFGPVGALLGGELYIDMSDPARFSAAVKELRDRIVAMSGVDPSSMVPPGEGKGGQKAASSTAGRDEEEVPVAVAVPVHVGEVQG